MNQVFFPFYFELNLFAHFFPPHPSISSSPFLYNPMPHIPAVDASVLQVQEDDHGDFQEEDQGDHSRLFSTV